MDDGILIVCGIVLLIFLFNLGILLPLLRRGAKTSSNPFKEYRHPWDVEQEAFTALHDKLHDLEDGSHQEEHPSDGK